MFQEFRDYRKRDQIIKSGLIFILIGIPVVVLFALADKSVIGINGTFKWRIAGMAPMLLFLVILLIKKITDKPIGINTARMLGSLLILGINGMMAAIFFIVLTDSSYANTMGLAGTIAGNLLCIFATGLLPGISGKRVSLSMGLPYLILIILLSTTIKLPVTKWVFIGNVLTAIPLVVVAVWQREKVDDARLLALYTLQEERKQLEKTVEKRTGELEILIHELHHRVRNNLQIILSIISITEYNKLNNITGKGFKIVKIAVQMVAKAHELTLSDDVSEKININHFLKEICSDSTWPVQGKEIECTIDESLVDINIAVTVGIICVILIHKVRNFCLVNFHCDSGKAVLTVAVDSKIKNTDGDLKIVEAFAEILASHLQETIEDNKTTIRIFFNL